MKRWLALLIAVLLPALMWASAARGDWASAQSSRGVTQEPNDFWYWHTIETTVSVWDFDPVTDISYDPDHTYFWHWGPNYLNMPRAWGVLLDADPEPIGIASSDTEFLVTHWDLYDNVYKNLPEFNGTPGVDDDGDGLVDNDLDFRLDEIYVSGVDRQDNYTLMGVPTHPPHQHGTPMSAQAVAVTNNEGWWLGRDPADYLQEVPNRLCGLPGLMWNRAKLVPNSPHGVDDIYVDWIAELNSRGANIKVASCSWLGHDQNWVDRLEGNGILVVAGSSNTNWEVNTGGLSRPCLIIGAVEKSYRRARISGPEDGVCYRVPTGAPERTIDVNGYIPYGGGLFRWASDEDSHLWGYNGRTISDSQIGGLSLGWYVSEGGEGTEWAQTVISMWPGVGGALVQGTEEDPRFSPSLMQTDFRTSGATTQAAGVAGLVASLYPHLQPDQLAGMVRRGCVTVDPFNTDTCCLDADKENCFTWTDGLNGNPVDGVMQDGDFDGSGEITARIEGESCAGLLGAGRLDAYRSMTLWGLVDQDTTFSGDVYVSGDVLIAGATVTVMPGTRFLIAPDDITYLDPWEPIPRYDMSNATGDGRGYFEDFPTTPYDQIEFVLYDAAATLLFLSTPENPAIFDSFVNDTQTADDWIGINDRASTRIFAPNGAGSYQVLHSTLGVH